MTRAETLAAVASLKQEHDSARAAGEHRIAREADRKATELLDRLAQTEAMRRFFDFGD